jgi:putative DNA primase/helicase
LEPGCKADNIPVLEGPQGALKSTAIELLFGRAWFTDDVATLGTKDSIIDLATTWGAELPELSSITRTDRERVKAFASRRVDIFRPPYGRTNIEVPRQSVMWATTNDTEWLDDPTGARRFWFIACGRVDLKRLKQERDQLWAEAVHWYSKGEPWWLTDSATVELARAEQERRQVADAWDEQIEEYLADKDDVSVAEVLQFAIGFEKPSAWRTGDEIRIGRRLSRRGWVRRRPGTGRGQKWRYFRPAGEEKQGKSQGDFGI